MGIMSVYAMDIQEFIDAKAHDSNRLNHFNVTVMVDDDFIDAVKNNQDIKLHYPVYDENGFILKDSNKWIYSKTANAKELWDSIIRKAYDNGEPGIAFCDTMNKDNNLWYIENIVATNPCFEYLAGTVYGKNPVTKEPLNPADYGGACNLGSLFLHNFIKNPFTENATMDMDLLENTIHTAVKFLDNIIDINKFPDPIYENYQKNFRTIGLGITGLADMLVMLNMKYNSKEANIYVDRLMDFIALATYEASIELSMEREPFPFLDKDKFAESHFINKHCDHSELLQGRWKRVKEMIKYYGIRNSKMLSVAPTGTLSLTYGNNCSSGLEPIFSLEYDRKVKMGGQSDEDIKIVTIRDAAYEMWNKIKGSPDVIVRKDKFVTAMNMTVDEHIDMLSVIAKHVDMSCSKTINVPTEYSFEDTKSIYMRCHDEGIKGCTIFRPNELRQGILIDDNQKKSEKSEPSELKRGMIIKADDNVVGKKRTLQTGCGTLHCIALFDPVTGDLLETYLSKGSTGGCVSAETEFYNGTEWKPISEYQDGEKVLQYHKDGEVSLVEPLQYIVNDNVKELRHFLGEDIDMVLSDDHRIYGRTHDSADELFITVEDWLAGKRPEYFYIPRLVGHDSAEDDFNIDDGYLIGLCNLDSAKVTTVPTTDNKSYCFTVPSSKLVLRYNGKVFITANCNNFMIGLSRMISIAARGGIDVYSIVDQLQSTGSCPSYAARSATKHDTSKGSCCPMAVGNAILSMYKEMQKEINCPGDEEETSNPAKVTKKKTAIKKSQHNNKSIKRQQTKADMVYEEHPLCPECGEPMDKEGGCIICKSCGWSKCD